METGIVYLDRAVSALAKLALPTPKYDPQNPVMLMLNQLTGLDQDDSKVVLISQALQSMAHFNQVVRDNVCEMTYSDRYQAITQAFDSIRDDTKMMLDHLADGKLSFSEKAQERWMKLRRGTVEDRFANIKKDYLDVARDSGQQIDREKTILTAYGDFRLALKEAEIAAKSLVKIAVADTQAKQTALKDAAAKVADDGIDAEEKAQRELARDVCQRDLNASESRQHVAEKIAENLTVSYQTGELIMARLGQTTGVKEQIVQQMVLFFSTNENTFTGLSAALTSLMGLNEATGTMEAMKAGTNQALETLAGIGDESLMKGLEAAHGPTIAASSVGKLADAVVDFQEKQQSKIQELRKASAENTRMIEESVESSKQRFAEITAAAEMGYAK